MLWKLADGTAGAEGNVSAVEPPRLLRYSFKANDPKRSKQENLTFRLDEFDGRSKLSVSVGDFGDTPEHEACYPGAVEAWDRSLPRIKDLAER